MTREPYAIKGRAHICVHSECDYPAGQCLGRCNLLHRVNTRNLPDDRASFVMGSTEDPIQFAEDEPMPLAARIAIIVMLALIVGALVIPLSF